jgi:GTP pyrophosphokinase
VVCGPGRLFPGLTRRMFELSKSAVNQAGAELREWWGVDDDLGSPIAPTEALYAFRAEFPVPTKKVTVGLRQFVLRECEPSAQLIVGQRLKRAPQIVEKLWRHPKMKLSRMQDIGGCRAILLGGHEEVDRVAQRIERNWTVKHRKHYTLEAPADGGYRARHLVVERDSRLIEIQLRTPRQHEWAEAIERTDKRLPFSLKAGQGPEALLEYFRLASDGLAYEDAGETPDPAFLRHFRKARERARPYLERS